LRKRAKGAAGALAEMPSVATCIEPTDGTYRTRSKGYLFFQLRFAGHEFY
jgi:hypothetical protein